jgi:DNA replication protein DnaC
LARWRVTGVTGLSACRTKSKWNSIFYDEKMTNAIIDRLIHHSHLLVFTGPSYRLTQLISHSAMAGMPKVEMRNDS